MKSIPLRRFLMGAAIAGCVAVSQVGWAQQAAERPPGSPAAAVGAPVTGSVVSVGSDRVVLKYPDGTQHTQIIEPNAKITLNGKAAKLPDLKAGDTVVYSLPTGQPDMALSIAATRGPQPAATPAPPVAASPQPPARPAPADRGLAGQAGLGVLVAPSDVAKGVRVLDIEPNSPAALAGLMPGDLITAFDKKEVNSPRDLIERIQANQPGSKVEVAYTRGAEARTVTATLMDRSAVVHGPVPGWPFRAGPIMAPPPGMNVPGQLSQHEQHLETLLQQVLNEVQQLRREVQDLRGKQGAATGMHNSGPQPERK